MATSRRDVDRSGPNLSGCLAPRGIREDDLQHFYFCKRTFPVHWLLRTLYNTCHIHPHWWRRLPCNVPTANQKQFRVQYLAQGHVDMQLGWARDLNQRLFWLLDDLLLLTSSSGECLYKKKKKLPKLKLWCRKTSSLHLITWLCLQYVIKTDNNVTNVRL